jgi:hypothetical protein
MLRLNGKIERTAEETRQVRFTGYEDPTILMRSRTSQASQRLSTSRPEQEFLFQVGEPCGAPRLDRSDDASLGSYSYDLTNTLQSNLTRRTPFPTFNTHFMWNYHLTQEAFHLRPETNESSSDDETVSTRLHPDRYSSWVLPFIHGSLDQASLYSRLQSRYSSHQTQPTYLFARDPSVRTNDLYNTYRQKIA